MFLWSNLSQQSLWGKYITCSWGIQLDEAGVSGHPGDQVYNPAASGASVIRGMPASPHHGENLQVFSTRHLVALKCIHCIIHHQAIRFSWVQDQHIDTILAGSSRKSMWKRMGGTPSPVVRHCFVSLGSGLLLLLVSGSQKGFPGCKMGFAYNHWLPGCLIEQSISNQEKARMSSTEVHVRGNRRTVNTWLNLRHVTSSPPFHNLLRSGCHCLGIF